ncbi:LPS export ABC transporter periplasmic protein LptC [Halomonas lysinitropha]|uniref:Lipopolysaccharide-assembly, LptC-related n=1 Tax=Halomonas lysinitropha TaxID=2607506 RepID=A0A5K1IAC0_9GAMM|nr:LPS export ABC transporter periplasmic protein LptC [Halomonas lysinitropha]VVZ96082.1 Lipopolysaccharide-assembly, LptC-related [Halomonas lysinitropha]
MRLPRPGFRTGLLVLLLALGGGLAMLDLGEDPPPGPVPGGEAGEPDYYLEEARLTRFDTQGRPHQRLDTPRLTHTPHDDITRLERPKARLLDDSGRSWLASGEQGTLGTGGNPLTLSGDARLLAPAERWQLDTEVLHFDAESGHAWSDTPALLRQPPQRMRGERFDAWLHDNRARLTDNVRGHHPPDTREAPES